MTVQVNTDEFGGIVVTLEVEANGKRMRIPYCTNQPNDDNDLDLRSVQIFDEASGMWIDGDEVYYSNDFDLRPVNQAVLDEVEELQLQIGVLANYLKSWKRSSPQDFG